MKRNLPMLAFIATGYIVYSPTLKGLFLLIATALIIHIAIKFLKFSLDPLLWIKMRILTAYGKRNDLGLSLYKVVLDCNIENKTTLNRRLEALVPTAIFAKSLVEMVSSPALILVMFLGYYFYTIAITVLLFGILLKFSLSNYHLYSFFDFLLASLMRFFSWSNPTGVFDENYNTNWIWAFESLMTFYYFVLAIMVFSVTAQYSVKNLRELAIIVYKNNFENKTKELLDLAIEDEEKATQDT